jgi:hypothetical protein
MHLKETRQANVARQLEWRGKAARAAASAKQRKRPSRAAKRGKKFLEATTFFAAGTIAWFLIKQSTDRRQT